MTRADYKKKRRRFMKVNIFEGSAVGIPAYADAHFSAGDFDLVKALSNSIPVRRAEIPSEKTMAEEEQTTTPVEEAEEAEAPEAESEAEAPEEAEAPAEEQKSISLSEKDLKALISGAVSEAIKSQRGLIAEESSEEKLKAELSKKSIGELAMEMGFFK